MNYTEEDLKKLQGKNSFLIQKSMYEDIKLMSEAETHYLIMRIFEYVLFGQIPDLEKNREHRYLLSAFNRFKTAYDSDSSKWLESCKKKSANKKIEWDNRKKDKQSNPTEHPIYK